MDGEHLLQFRPVSHVKLRQGVIQEKDRSFTGRFVQEIEFRNLEREHSQALLATGPESAEINSA